MLVAREPAAAADRHEHTGGVPLPRPGGAFQVDDLYADPYGSRGVGAYDLAAVPERPVILLVDDQADVRFMLSLFLEDEGVDFEEADSGEEALERADAAVPTTSSCSTSACRPA